MRYWLDTFNEETWAEFEAAGSSISGFPAKRENTVNLLEEGDILVCYVTGKKVFNAVLKVVGKPRTDTRPIWKSDIYPIRIPVEVSHSIPITHGVLVETLKDQLTWFHDLTRPSSWTFRIRNSPYEISEKDARIIIQAIYKASESTKRVSPSGCGESGSESTHDSIQSMLLSLGNEMGLDLWVARNDRNKSFQGNVFSETPRLRRSLPVQFDQATQKIIEHIDVLWLQGNSIIAAFEIEHTSAIYSGLLRMSDLIALQPNLNIDLFIVAPDERRDKVKSEINRPTFAKLKLLQRCRYIAYSRLTQKIDQATRGGFLRHLSHTILDELAEKMTN